MVTTIETAVLTERRGVRWDDIDVCQILLLKQNKLPHQAIFEQHWSILHLDR